MYVREKKIRRGEKTYSYWQVVQETRVDGKVSQTVVGHVGVAEDREQADRRARMKGLLCGAQGCRQAGVVQLEAGTWPPVLGRRVKKEWLLCPAHFDAHRRREVVRGWALWPPRGWDPQL